MAISICGVVPRIAPDYCLFSRGSKERGLYPYNNNNYYVALTRSGSGQASSPISYPRTKASHAAFTSEKQATSSFMLQEGIIDDTEVQEELNGLQIAYLMLKGSGSKSYFGDITLVQAAANHFLRLLRDAIMVNNVYICWLSLVASYGAFLMLREFVNRLWASQIMRHNIVLGYLIYKISIRNIALYKKDLDPEWLFTLFGLVFGKLIADCWVLYTCPAPVPLNVISPFDVTYCGWNTYTFLPVGILLQANQI